MEQTAELIPSYFAQIARIDEGELLTHEEEIELSRRAKAGDESARKRLIENNLRGVISVAKKYRSRGLPFEDLIQEGNIGLMEAAARFDPARGTRLLTFADEWIKGMIRKAFAAKGRAIPQAVPSLDEPVRTESDSMEHRESLKDQVKDEETDIEAAVIQHLEHTRLWEAIGELSPREQHVVVRKYGLDHRESATLAELSNELSVTPARVRQVQHNAERHLRERLVSRLRMSMPQRPGVGKLPSVARCTT